MNFKTIREAAELLTNVSESKLRRAIRAGDIPSMRLGNRTVVDIDTAAALLKEPQGVGIKTVSEQTGLTTTAIYRGIHEGWIPYEKPGKTYIFQTEKVRAAIVARVEQQTKARKNGK